MPSTRVRRPGGFDVFDAHVSKVDVVEAAYSVLQSKLGAVEDFVSFQRGHQEFLSTLRAKFYLDNLEISQVRRLTRTLRRHHIRLPSCRRSAEPVSPGDHVAVAVWLCEAVGGMLKV